MGEAQFIPSNPKPNMELSQNTASHQPTVDHARSRELEIILQGIDKLVETTISENSILLRDSNTTSFRSHQSALLRGFRGMMVEIQSKASKAAHEVGSKLGPDSQLGHSHPSINERLEDLVGVSPESALNRVLGRTHLNGKQSYKLRDFATGDPDPQLVTGDDTNMMLPPSLDGPVVVLQPTLRNVYVVQHAYVRLLNHKEELIKEYLDSVPHGPGSSRKFSREHYENLSLANLPSKTKLGTLLDVKYSSYSHSTQDLGLVLVSMNIAGNLQYVEAVTGELLNIRTDDEDSHYIVLPVAEASIKKLYDTYRSLRDATSKQRRAAKDKEFAAKLPEDAMDVLAKQFGDEEPKGVEGSGSKKRRRMLEDDE